MSFKPSKLILLLISVLVGYGSLLFFLGDPGDGLLGNGLSKDLALRN